jgi:2'-deoxynucleoside 5'-phosphate N-hydrolase
MQIYFARSIRGSHKSGDNVFFNAIVNTIKECGHVPALETKPIQDPHGVDKNVYIYQRDIEWIDQSQAMIAEVSNASLGVGYEIAYAKHVRQIPILAVARTGVNVSAMIQGSLPMVWYTYMPELARHVRAFLSDAVFDKVVIDPDHWMCSRCGEKVPARVGTHKHFCTASATIS